jgi:hypothetical protein
MRRGDGGEFIGRAIPRLAAIASVAMLYIAPGSQRENGYAESLHGRLQDELLNAEVFAGLHDAKALATRWWHEYNQCPRRRSRPISARCCPPPPRAPAATVMDTGTDQGQVTASWSRASKPLLAAVGTLIGAGLGLEGQVTRCLPPPCLHPFAGTMKASLPEATMRHHFNDRTTPLSPHR